MTTYFAATGLDAFAISLTDTPTDDGNNGFQMGGIDTSYADATLLDPATGEPTTATSLWTNLVYSPGPYGFQTGRIGLRWYNDAGQVVMQCVGSPGGAGITIQIWNGSAFVNVATFEGLGGNYNLNTFDFRINIAVSGTIEFYFNSALGGVYNLDTSGMVNVAKLRIGAYTDASRVSHCASVLVASYNTISHVVRYRRPNGNGAEQQWAGDYSSINGGNIDDSHSVNTSTVGNVSDFTGPDFPAVPAGSVIKAVTLGNRVRVVTGGGGPTNIQPTINIGGTDYPGPNLPINSGFSGSLAIYENDPSTSAPWTVDLAHINGQSFGVKAVA